MIRKNFRDSAVALLDNERRRQIEEENYDPASDRGRWRSLARAAAAYAGFRAGIDVSRRLLWPWGDPFWKPAEGETTEAAIHDLKRSGALILAALEDLLATQADENARTYIFIGSTPRAHQWAQERGIDTQRVHVLNGQVTARERLQGVHGKITLVDGHENTLSYRDVLALLQIKALATGKDEWREVGARVS